MWAPGGGGSRALGHERTELDHSNLSRGSLRTNAKGLSVCHITALSQGREIVLKRTFSKKNSTVDFNRHEKELEDRLIEIIQSESRKKKE